MKLYCIQALVVTTDPTTSHEVPTFYLHPDVQGIISVEHAGKIARDILSAAHPKNVADYHIHVEEVEIEVAR